MITARLRSGEFANPPYTAGSPSSASVTVNDNDDPPTSSPGVPPSRGPKLGTISSVSFTITDGETATKSIGVGNDGTGTIQVTSITTDVDGLSLDKTSFNVTANSSEAVKLTFTSTTTGTRSGSITVVSSAGTATIPVSVTVNPIVTLATLTLKKNTASTNGKVTFNLTMSLARDAASLSVTVGKRTGGFHWDGVEYYIIGAGSHHGSRTYTLSNSGTTETVEVGVKITRVANKALGQVGLQITSPLDTRAPNPRIVNVIINLDTVKLD